MSGHGSPSAWGTDGCLTRVRPSCRTSPIPGVHRGNPSLPRLTGASRGPLPRDARVDGAAHPSAGEGRLPAAGRAVQQGARPAHRADPPTLRPRSRGQRDGGVRLRPGRGAVLRGTRRGGLQGHPGRGPGDGAALPLRPVRRLGVHRRRGRHRVRRQRADREPPRCPRTCRGQRCRTTSRRRPRRAAHRARVPRGGGLHHRGRRDQPRRPRRARRRPRGPGGGPDTGAGLGAARGAHARQAHGARDRGRAGRRSARRLRRRPRPRGHGHQDRGDEPAERARSPRRGRARDHPGGPGRT
jgi:hypothetical protein